MVQVPLTLLSIDFPGAAQDNLFASGFCSKRYALQWRYHGSWLLRTPPPSSNQTNCIWQWSSSSQHSSTQCSSLWQPLYSSHTSQVHHRWAWEDHAHVSFQGWFKRPCHTGNRYIQWGLSGRRRQKPGWFWCSLVRLGSLQQFVCHWELGPVQSLVAVESSIHQSLSADQLGEWNQVGCIRGLRGHQYPLPVLTFEALSESLGSLELCFPWGPPWPVACWMLLLSW